MRTGAICFRCLVSVNGVQAATVSTRCSGLMVEFGRPASTYIKYETTKLMMIAVEYIDHGITNR